MDNHNDPTENLIDKLNQFEVALIRLRRSFPTLVPNRTDVGTPQPQGRRYDTSRFPSQARLDELLANMGEIFDDLNSLRSSDLPADLPDFRSTLEMSANRLLDDLDTIQSTVWSNEHWALDESLQGFGESAGIFGPPSTDPAFSQSADQPVADDGGERDAERSSNTTAPNSNGDPTYQQFFLRGIIDQASMSSEVVCISFMRRNPIDDSWSFIQDRAGDIISIPHEDLLLVYINQDDLPTMNER
ncbi:hypothetical protein NW762_013769 [Fusarium torreyae]|uniref:Uncharacterized protein n=1 Tax=Fusarium torreyae TaxID=1237075 RepID=A0A9W8RNG4_9HYPO|nr:hypothetical protein NW762_013769 [Fusarium torreyae]